MWLNSNNNKKSAICWEKILCWTFPPLCHCRSVLLNRAIKKFCSDFFIAQGFCLTGVERYSFPNAKAPPSPGKKKNLFGQLVLKRYQVLGEEEASKKSHFCIGLCCLIRLSSQSTTLCVYSFNLYCVNEPVKCLKRCLQLSSRTRTALLKHFLVN